ncbi:hypothetical protein RhiirA5_379322 [Rhizophagus irregularis]|uniref:Uncharacterized protein n=1 Tax=Rhizophagus irregularis TaxID=588596 RepID=A0A2N0PCG1_9GLOM|nr:hypothetical protein RhiirA5_379322 [Rhizophagus irregularis]PKC61606.1 hypothetical protein RhiirA1_398290 [Rhizophagus irregularis]
MTYMIFFKKEYTVLRVQLFSYNIANFQKELWMVFSETFRCIPKWSLGSYYRFLFLISVGFSVLDTSMTRGNIYNYSSGKFTFYFLKVLISRVIVPFSLWTFLQSKDVIQVKGEDINQGVGRNAIQLQASPPYNEALREDVMYGIVLTGVEWVIIKLVTTGKCNDNNNGNVEVLLSSQTQFTFPINESVVDKSLMLEKLKVFVWANQVGI